MPKIIAIKPMRLRFAPGQKMRDFPVGEHELTDAEMDNWYVRGCLKEGRAQLPPAAAEATDQAPAKTQAKGAATAQGDTLRSKLLALFPTLGPDDLKKDGVPKVQAVEAALGEGVSAADVASAWDEYQAQGDKKGEA